MGRAAHALGQIGEPATDAVPALIARLNKNKGRSRDDAEVIEALMRIAPRRKEAVPGLRAILREPPSNPCRIHAVVALGKMGPDAKEAVPDLIKMLAEAPGKAGPIRFHAATALGRIGCRGEEGGAGAGQAAERKKGRSWPTHRRCGAGTDWNSGEGRR